MVSMAHNWLASAELPASFWFYAVHRAAEICNYFPSKLDSGQFATPFELVHRQKPDLRVLFPMFGLAAVRRERIGDSKLTKFDAQSPNDCSGSLLLAILQMGPLCLQLIIVFNHTLRVELASGTNINPEDSSTI
jgi:hypothetical protein